MGNKLAVPFPTVDVARSSLNANEMAKLKQNYKNLSQSKNVISLSNFHQIPLKIPSSEYFRNHILQKMFYIMDTKKDGVIDFDEFLCAAVLFQRGSIEDKLRFIYLMYEPVKGGYLTRDQVRQVIIDSIVVTQKSEIPLQIEAWIHDMRDLHEGMIEMIFYQFAVNDAKIDFQEFLSIAQFESSIQGLLKIMTGLLSP